jgi:hypothetical protein
VGSSFVEELCFGIVNCKEAIYFSLGIFFGTHHKVENKAPGPQPQNLNIPNIILRTMPVRFGPGPCNRFLFGTFFFAGVNWVSIHFFEHEPSRRSGEFKEVSTIKGYSQILTALGVISIRMVAFVCSPTFV